MKKIISFVMALMLVAGMVITVSAEEYVSRTGWQIMSSSVFPSGDNPPENMIDGNADTYWHSYYGNSGQDKPPYYITIIMPEKQKISGISYTPRTDNSSGIVTAFNVYASDTDTGRAWYIFSGGMERSYDKTEISFGFNIEVQTVIVEITAGVWDYGTCAELNFLKDDSSLPNKTISEYKERNLVLAIGQDVADVDGILTEADFVERSNWTINVSSQREMYYPGNIIDGNISTIWHTDYSVTGNEITEKAPYPHWFEIILPEATEISGFQYTARADGSTGIFEEYEFYVAENDNDEYIKLVSGADMTQKFNFNIKVKKVKLVALKAKSDFGTCAEFNLIKKRDELKTLTELDSFAEENEKLALGDRLVKITDTSMTATSNCDWTKDTAAQNVVDGNITNTWHSDANRRYEFPIELTVDLAGEYKVKAIEYYPRQTQEMIGVWNEIDIYAKSENDKDFRLIEAGRVLRITLNTQTITFEEPVQARYFKFVIKYANLGYATCSELMFYEKEADAENRLKDNYYIMQIGSNVLTTVKDGVKTEKELDVAPFIDKSYTLIPLRGLFEEMGADISWDGEKRKITIELKGVKIVMQINNDLVYVTNSKYGEVRYTLRVFPKIVDERTFVPLRFISENLGYKVEWDGTTQTIKIS